MRKSEQESETEEQYEVRWRLDKDAAKEEDRGEVDSGVRNADGDGTVGLISSGERLFRTASPLVTKQPCSRRLAAARQAPACVSLIWRLQSAASAQLCVSQASAAPQASVSQLGIVSSSMPTEGLSNVCM